MKFVLETIANKGNGAIARVYTPELDGVINDTAQPFTECDIDGTVRFLSTDVLKMMRTFNEEAERRRSLLHDCVVFALACTTGDPYTHQPFDPGIKPVQVEGYNFFATHEGASFLQEPDIDAGKVAFTVDASPLDPDFRDKTHKFHFMVRATRKHDLQKGLYISKFGVMGEVALHEFSATYGFYPAVAAGSIGGMRLKGPAT